MLFVAETWLGARSAGLSLVWAGGGQCGKRATRNLRSEVFGLKETGIALSGVRGGSNQGAQGERGPSCTCRGA